MKLPFSIGYHNGDNEIYVRLERDTLNMKELKSLIDHLDAFYRDMLPDPRDEDMESIADMMKATWDDDPNPYHGDYSEE